MKKLIFSFLALALTLSLVGCGGETEVENGGTNNNNTNNNTNNNQSQNSNASDEEKFLTKFGLKMSDIEPDEEYYRVDFDEDEFTFYMEKGTERNVGKYINKVYNACKNVASDGKIYKASFNFYMRDGNVEEYAVKSENEINEGFSFMHLDQFGYYYGNLEVAVTVSALTDMDGERDDDVYYPVYSISLLD